MTQENNEADSSFVRTAAARKRLGVTHKVLYSLIRSGKLAAVDVGTGKTPRYVIRNTDIDGFLNRRRVNK